jgi:hypothetical protein
VLLEDLATSGEVVWRWPQIRSSWSLGQVPGRWFFFVLRSSSVELVDTAVLRRLWARSSSAPWMRASGACFRRLRRWRLCVAELLEACNGGVQLCCLLYPSSFFFACIRWCNGSLLV